MKKVFIFLFTFLYLLSAGGVPISIHYCGNTISTVSFGYDAKGHCKCGNKKMNSNCCKNKHFFAKVKDAHKPNTYLKVSFNENFIPQHLAVITLFHLTYFTPSFSSLYSKTDPPPNTFEQRAYIMYRTLLI